MNTNKPDLHPSLSERQNYEIKNVLFQNISMYSNKVFAQNNSGIQIKQVW